MMIICSNCGVQLEPDMEICPLCETPVNIGTQGELPTPGRKPEETRRMTRPQRKATWEVSTIIFVLVMVVVSSIDLIISMQISWSEYPMAVCLVIFSYLSVFSFMEKRKEVKLIVSLGIASFLIFVIDTVGEGSDWALFLGIPILFFVNFFIICWILILRLIKQRGINLIAFAVLILTLISISIEIIVDLYLKDKIHLIWSLIVGACALPVAAVLLFMHYRMKKGRDLNKTFHI